MNRVILTIILPITSLILSVPGFSQDAFAEHKIKGLKGLRNLSVVIEPSTQKDIDSLKEWVDMVELGLHRKAPEITLSEVKKSSAWLVLSIATTEEGCFLELSIFRWVKVLDTGEEIFSKTWWDSRIIFGDVTRKSMQDALDILLTSFAADYLRAKR
ncbi:MAG: hypothetical protein UZ01_01888 [Candidatus Brocadia sinica]|uniref:Uncharacterized protein n=1 Tax=Candidatus Brocadia sinica JPN1 TaxID=1197129 RepID=A0ABQ0JUJ7_9BACT|nr:MULTISPECIES: hypothetical protein [Brocadia]KXK29912.1 MAG: hypothetical protein UZ01_01888 [Candidatus Brocadia sinica]NOG41745.1 hypothetical protein [Planctomycetota bacterium]MDL1936178.1 hypothetical protein [Candidatus Brocadia sp. AMX2]GAN32368.1 hypothetical protein BROSI_A0880 [Candidatus Brocadia sinica JPN1]GIK14084.1 MAG: hypothetical protein BroJett002_27910 [Candidatus Brocadia sinica]